ncbi:MAG: FtsX-like permease family protein [Chitinophagia bacterium]|jgi:putative ABC transport system permease protein|nr:FtsX-like permease family protein [Chitinophagia bacterium]
MKALLQLIQFSFIQAIQELRVNRLRTTLSLLGISIGIFCIIAVLTVLDSMERNIRKEVATLGSDVVYINRWPWMDEGGEYKWWDFLRRPSMGVKELKAVNGLPHVQFATLCFSENNLTIKNNQNELSGVNVYAVMPYFENTQNLEIVRGRYFSTTELEAGTACGVLGDKLYNELFPSQLNPIGTYVFYHGKKIKIIGLLKKMGQSMSGFDFDNGMLVPYYVTSSMLDLKSLQYDPMLIVKASNEKSLEEMTYELTGVLRAVRKVKPTEANNFAINKLSQISDRLDTIFATINIVGFVIGGFSLIVGAFGIANIMFVTVKERTKMIGLKKAIGAPAATILMEFLTEAVILCLLGGLFGIISVFLLSLLATYLADFEMVLTLKNIGIGTSISLLVGVLAGYIPAKKAAALNPVEAIRSH